MGIFLNSSAPLAAYEITVSDRYFVDKTLLIEELIPSIGREQRFLCITRPRRFGKTVMANMIAAYFGKAADSTDLFNLCLARSPRLLKWGMNCARYKILTHGIRYVIIDSVE